MRVRQIAVVGAAVPAAVSSASGYTNPIERGVEETVWYHWDIPDEILIVGDLTSENSLHLKGTGAIGNRGGSDNNLVSLEGVFGKTVPVIHRVSCL